MGWLDHVVSIPVIGLQIRPNLRLSMKYLDVLAPLIDEFVGEFGDVDIRSSANQPGHLIVRVKDGYSYTLAYDNLVIGYKHPVRTVRRPGQLPTVEVPDVSPYSQLLDAAARYAKRLIEPLSSHGFAVQRIGVVATSLLARDTLPPGVKDWIDHLGAFWNRELKKSETTLLVDLAETEQYVSRCHHMLSFDLQGSGEEVKLVLDWQRCLKRPVDRSVPSELDGTIADALDYFERFGGGLDT